MTPDPGQPPVFGARRAGTPYRERRGAYGVALDGHRVLIVDGSVGRYLPGGGLGADESELDGLRREVREETGYDVAAAVELGQARELIVTRAEGEPIEKLGTFFAVRLADGRPAVPLEDDAVVGWIPVEEALSTLAEGSHRWALERALERLREA